MAELAPTVARLRAALDEDPESIDFAQLRAPASPAAASALPGGVAEVWLLADGPRCGAITCFTAARLPGAQFYCDELDEPERWFCFGVNSDDPLFIRRDTGAVWHHPYSGTVRAQGAPLAPLADDVPAFFERYVFGPGYRDIAYEDQWWALLTALGLTGGGSDRGGDGSAGGDASAGGPGSAGR